MKKKFEQRHMFLREAQREDAAHTPTEAAKVRFMKSACRTRATMGDQRQKIRYLKTPYLSYKHNEGTIFFSRVGQLPSDLRGLLVGLP